MKVIENLDPFTYITEEHLEYEPTMKDTFMYHKKTGDYQRLIWGDPQELRERETERMDEFLEYVEKNNHGPIPEFYFGADRMGYRMLQGNGWKYEKAALAIKDHYNWHQSTYPFDGAKCLPFLQSGACYIQGRCKEGHQPIIVLNIKKFIDQKATVLDLQDIATFFFEWLCKFMIVQGRIESWLVIIDFKDVYMSQIPV